MPAPIQDCQPAVYDLLKQGLFGLEIIGEQVEPNPGASRDVADRNGVKRAIRKEFFRSVQYSLRRRFFRRHHPGGKNRWPASVQGFQPAVYDLVKQSLFALEIVSEQVEPNPGASRDVADRNGVKHAIRKEFLRSFQYSLRRRTSGFCTRHGIVS